jgi:hypothetical protein
MRMRNTLRSIVAVGIALLGFAGGASAQQLAFVAQKHLPTSLEERDRQILVLVSRDARAPISESEIRVAVPALFRENGFMIRDTSFHRISLRHWHAVVRLSVRENGLVTIRGEQRCGRYKTYRLDSEARRRFPDAASLVPDLRRVAEELAEPPVCADMERISALGRGPSDTGSARRAREVEQRRRDAERAPATSGTPPSGEVPRRPPLREN